MLLFFPKFDNEVHANKDVVQFPLHLSRHLKEPLIVASEGAEQNFGDYSSKRVSSFRAFVRLVAKHRDETVVLFFLTGTTKTRAILLKLLFPKLRIVVKSDQNEAKFRIGRHLTSFWRREGFFSRPLINRLFYRSVSQICVETSSVYRQFAALENVGHKFRHVPNGSSVIPNLSEKKNTIVFVGRYDAEQKNFSLLLDALKKISGSLHDWSVEVIGGQEKESDFLPVTYLGMRPHAETIEHMRAAKILALSSLYEGSPIVFSEAKAAGCAIMTTDVSSAGDYVTSTNDGAIAQISVEHYAEALKELLQRCEQGQIDFADIQTQYLEKFDWDKNTAKVAAKLNS